MVRRLTRTMFQERLSRGEWDRIVRQLAPDVHHVFPGDHPLGGERHTRDAVERWFERLGRLFPGHDFEVHRIVVRGWPWRTWVVVAWSAQLEPRSAPPYRNDGTHWVQLRWGQVTYFHGYLDTEAIAAACREMASRGIDEAAAAPIRDARVAR